MRLQPSTYDDEPRALAQHARSFVREPRLEVDVEPFIAGWPRIIAEAS